MYINEVEIHLCKSHPAMAALPDFHPIMANLPKIHPIMAAILEPRPTMAAKSKPSAKTAPTMPMPNSLPRAGSRNDPLPHPQKIEHVFNNTDGKY